MTHVDIYNKFMIEYDKANITSSYPSLTPYEVNTILDKAYLALISQKVTGNNIRRSDFEADTKSVSDIQPLIKNQDLSTPIKDSVIANLAHVDLPSDFLYSVSCFISYNGEARPMQLISHQTADRFYKTYANDPWIKYPVYYLQDGKVYFVYDLSTFNRATNIEDEDFNVDITYIRMPDKFVEGSDSDEFELNDSMAEELISLAVVFALENVESSRLNSKLTTRGLEA